MPTVGEQFLRTHALGHLNRLKRLRTKKMKKAASERVPMESQIGQVLKDAGIEYVKPAAIIKRIMAKGKPLPGGAPKVSAGSAPPDSSHHQLPVRRTTTLDIGQDSTNPKLAGAMFKARARIAAQKGKGIAETVTPAGGVTTKIAPPKAESFVSKKWTGRASKPMYTGMDISRALGSDPSKGWERLSEAEARALLKLALYGPKALLSMSKNVKAPLGGKPAKSTGVSVSTRMPKQQGASPPPVLPMAPMQPMQPFAT